MRMQANAFWDLVSSAHHFVLPLLANIYQQKTLIIQLNYYNKKKPQNLKGSERRAREDFFSSLGIDETRNTVSGDS